MFAELQAPIDASNCAALCVNVKMADATQEPTQILGDAAIAKLPKAVVVNGAMPLDTQKVVIEKAAEGIVNYKVEKDQAMHAKKALEAWNGGMWHVIIGTAFGASVAHEAGCMLLVRFGKTHVLAVQSFDETALTGNKEKRVGRGIQKKDDEEEGGASAE